MLSQEFHKLKRDELMNSFKDIDGVIYISGNSEVSRNDQLNDLNYEFRQSSTFRYLTGVNKPDFSMVLISKEEKYILFGPEMTPEIQVWVGTQPSHEETKEMYNANEIHTPEKLVEIIKSYKPQEIHTIPGTKVPFISDFVDNKFIDLGKKIYDMRMYKDKEEISEIEKSLTITADLHEALMRSTQEGKFEYELKKIAAYFYEGDGTTFAYPQFLSVH